MNSRNFPAKMKVLLTIISFAGILFFASRAEAVIYTGSLETVSGIDGTGIWATDFKIAWEITDLPSGDWQYTYAFSDIQDGELSPDISHWILEISPAARPSDFWGMEGPTEIRTFSPTGSSGSNPNMPGNIFGMKFDFTDTEYSFFSAKAPVWGDFYSKSGNAGGLGRNAVWNRDFLNPDPSAGPSSGLLSNGLGGYHYKILRPDTVTLTPPPSVPEPATLFLVSLGFLGTFFRRLKLF